MKKLVKLVKVNNLQYNPNRDPEVYRRVTKENFRIQALLDGNGTAKAKVEVEGNGETFTQDIRLDVMDHAWVG